jgi:nucleoid DNA-binding protein
MDPSTQVTESVQETKEKKAKTVSAVSPDFVKLLKDDLVSSDLKLKDKELKVIAESFIRVLISEVKQGKTVSFTNNMTFKRALRGERVHKNPKTGEEVVKKAHYVMSMDVKPALKKTFEAVAIDASEVTEIANEEP